MLYTAESVSPRHPDKIADQISDLILDNFLLNDPHSRVAIETVGGHGHLTITGEVTSNTHLTKNAIRNIIIQEFSELANFDISINIELQSRDIAKGVDTGGAGDQGIMIGYACNSNSEFIPQEYYLARKLCQHIYKIFPYDGKTQVTIDDDSNIKAVVASFQNVSTEDLSYIVKQFYPHSESYFINPAGDWSIGGFDADTGLTGRKIAIDNYGPLVPIGGGAFSGKDGTKVDRSGAYMARKIAVDYLKKYNAFEVIVKLAYSIGIAEPVMAVARIKTNKGIEEVQIEGYDLTPQGIIEKLYLREPGYFQTAKWGSMGNNFYWN